MTMGQQKAKRHKMKSILVVNENDDPKITFELLGEIVLVLNKAGFIYKGKTVEDAGVAYRLFTDFLERSLSSHENNS